MRGSKAIAGAILGFSLAVAPAASAKTYEVTRFNDPVPGNCKPTDCSLREAVRAANAHGGADVVLLESSQAPYRLTRPNQGPLAGEDESLRGDLDVTGALTISHPGGGLATIDANGIDRVLHVLPGGPTKLVRIKLTGGEDPAFSPEPLRGPPARRGHGDEAGGGIYSYAPLKLVQSSIVKNSAAYGGGIQTIDAPLTMLRSKVAANTTTSGTSGGIDVADGSARIVRSAIVRNEAANAGGGITFAFGATFQIIRSRVAGNQAGTGIGGVYLYEATGKIAQSTINGNVAKGESDTGGIEVTQDSSLELVNSTLTRNRANIDGGGMSVGSSSSASLNSVTVARNVADADANATGSGGGLFNDGGTFTVVNSIIALNTANGVPDNCSGTVASGGGNVLGTTSGCTGFAPPLDLLGVNPKLGRLASNGGPTKTLALKKGSPAIGAARKPDAPKRDQRGRKRDNNPDSGAYER